MLRCLQSKTLLAGLAMFSMFFGAGNIIFPLAIGHYAGEHTLWAILGLLITAVAVPFTGLIAMILFDGDSKSFFGRIGETPGFLLELLIMLLLGPLGSTPRCIALSYTTFKSCVGEEFSPWIFCGMGCLTVFLCAVKKTRMLDLLGYILTPILLLSLIIIILTGFFTPIEVTTQVIHSKNVFLHGLIEGYNTMDLLAAFFFSSMVIFSLKQMFIKESNLPKVAFKASLIGASLLALIYIGFSYIASFHSSGLIFNGPDQLLGAITMKLMGPYAGMMVCIAIGFACLTTAIALSSVFAEFMHARVFQKKISYEISLFLTVGVTYFVSIFEFTGISYYLSPILQICYPALIVLTLLNIANRLMAFRPVKGPVFFTFATTLVSHLIK